MKKQTFVNWVLTCCVVSGIAFTAIPFLVRPQSRGYAQDISPRRCGLRQIENLGKSNQVSKCYDLGYAKLLISDEMFYRYYDFVQVLRVTSPDRFIGLVVTAKTKELPPPGLILTGLGQPVILTAENVTQFKEGGKNAYLFRYYDETAVRLIDLVLSIPNARIVVQSGTSRLPGTGSLLSNPDLQLYAKTIADQVKAVWLPPAMVVAPTTKSELHHLKSEGPIQTQHSDREYSVCVMFSLDHEGELERLQRQIFMTTSYCTQTETTRYTFTGLAELKGLEESALQAVLDASPFPRLPDTLKDLAHRQMFLRLAINYDVITYSHDHSNRCFLFICSESDKEKHKHHTQEVSKPDSIRAEIKLAERENYWETTSLVQRNRDHGVAQSGSPKGSATLSESPYQTVEQTSVYSQPREDSQTVATVDAGTQVNVVNTQGDWLEIRAIHGRPPGFIKRDSAVPLIQRR